MEVSGQQHNNPCKFTPWKELCVGILFYEYWQFQPQLLQLHRGAQYPRARSPVLFRDMAPISLGFQYGTCMSPSWRQVF